MGGAGCGLSVWRVGRDRGAGDSHSQAKDNAVCVGWGGGGEFVVCGVCRRAGCVCVCLGVQGRAKSFFFWSLGVWFLLVEAGDGDTKVKI